MDYLAESILGTLVVTVLLCRYRVAHHKGLSWATAAADTLIGNLLAFISQLVCHEGWHVFSTAAWSRSFGQWIVLGFLFCFIAIFSAVPALAITVYYQRRAERAGSPAV